MVFSSQDGAGIRGKELSSEPPTGVDALSSSTLSGIVRSTQAEAETVAATRSSTQATTEPTTQPALLRTAVQATTGGDAAGAATRLIRVFRIFM